MLDMLILESCSKKGIHKKLLAEKDLDRPLLRGTKLTCNGIEVWVEFKYENLPMFCYYCGQVGHNEMNCWTRKRDANSGNIMERQFRE